MYLMFYYDPAGKRVYTLDVRCCSSSFPCMTHELCPGITRLVVTAYCCCLEEL